MKEKLMQIHQTAKDLRRDLPDQGLNYKTESVLTWAIYEIELQAKKCIDKLEEEGYDSILQDT